MKNVKKLLKAQVSTWVIFNLLKKNFFFKNIFLLIFKDVFRNKFTLVEKVQQLLDHFRGRLDRFAAELKVGNSVGRVRHSLPYKAAKWRQVFGDIRRETESIEPRRSCPRWLWQKSSRAESYLQVHEELVHSGAVNCRMRHRHSSN